jgi:hypothetical protein
MANRSPPATRAVSTSSDVVRGPAIGEGGRGGAAVERAACSVPEMLSLDFVSIVISHLEIADCRHLRHDLMDASCRPM